MSHDSNSASYANCMQHSFSMNISIFASWTYPEGKLSSLKWMIATIEVFSLDKNGVFVRKTYKRNSVVSPRIAGLQSGCCFRHLILLQVPGPGPQLSFFTLRCWLSTAELGSSWEPCLFIQQSKSILSKSCSLSMNIIK